MAFEWAVNVIWNSWLFVGTDWKPNLGGKLCLKCGLADVVFHPVIVYRGLEKEVAHLHTVTANFLEKIKVDWILFFPDLSHVALPIPQDFLRLVCGVEPIGPAPFRTPTKRFEAERLAIEEPIEFLK